MHLLLVRLTWPGGRACYPAFWIRDFAMSLESGIFTSEEVIHALRLTVGCQVAEDWHAPSGSFVPRFAFRKLGWLSEERHRRRGTSACEAL